MKPIHPYRGAKADPHGPGCFSRPLRFFRCSDEVIDAFVVVVKVFLPMLLTILRGTALCRRREYTFNYFQYQDIVGCCDVVWWWFFTPDGAYDSVWDSVRPMTGKFFYYFQYHEDVGCVCMLNFRFSSNVEICPDNYNYSRLKLKDKFRSEKWELCLYGDKTIQVVCAHVQFLVSVTCPLCYDRAWGPDVQITAEVSAAAVHGVTG